MTTFVEADHPRGQAANAGQFREKVNDAPSGELTATVETLPICPRHGGEWGDDITCEGCVDDDGQMLPFEVDADGSPATPDLCARCDATATGTDGLCDRHTLRWGRLDIGEGSRTPWGPAQHVSNVGPGIIVASCAGHGGVKLSPERNREIPAALRNSSGWYEEDCEYHIPARYFPAEFAAQPHLRDHWTEETMREDSDRRIRDWYPDKWEKANGRELVKGESMTRDEQLWAREHENDFVTRYARTAATDPNLVRVGAKRESDGAEAEFLIPVDEYEARRDGDRGRAGRFAVDPSRHAQLPPKPAPVTMPEEPKEVRTATLPDIYEFQNAPLTPAARERVWGDLGKRWRLQDGRVLTLRDMIEQDGVYGVTGYEDNGRMKYSVELSTGGLATVTKATYDYLQTQGIADTRPAHIRASHDYQVASAKLFKETEGGDHRLWRDPKAKARAEKLSAEAERLKVIADAAWKAHNDRRDALIGSLEARAAAEEKSIEERERAAVVGGVTA
ncbi:MAG: hypothetical protein J0J04_07655 [Microbacterium sp.]|uniref:DUF7007 domain-containing protein n=1 Tax=Microbacterium sp. TaxID=51671 RepID=UPI001AC6AC7C|nr:hypothetical protein [Microbacterium sp.]MBN9214673.1 hypothetical protein [Microbacterium sp.]